MGTTKKTIKHNLTVLDGGKDNKLLTDKISGKMLTERIQLAEREIQKVFKPTSKQIAYVKALKRYGTKREAINRIKGLRKATVDSWYINEKFNSWLRSEITAYEQDSLAIAGAFLQDYLRDEIRKGEEADVKTIMQVDKKLRDIFKAKPKKVAGRVSDATKTFFKEAK